MGDLTPTVHNNPHPVCIYTAVWSFYIPILLQPDILLLHQIKNNEADDLFAYLEGHLQWGQGLVAAGASAGHFIHVTRAGRGSIYRRPVAPFIQL